MRMNPNYTPDILNSLWPTEAQQQTATEQLATGLRVSVPSDDPTAAAEDVENLSLQSSNDQYQQSTTDLEGMLQTADSSFATLLPDRSPGPARAKLTQGSAEIPCQSSNLQV